MKLRTLFMSMVAGLALVGCSSEEDVLKGGPDPVEGETGYVAVNIVQPRSVGIRATTGDFENGSEAENSAREGLFFIFDGSGNVQTIDSKSAQRVALTGSGTTETPAVERIYSAVLLINGVTEDPTDNAKQIVCILNAPANLEDGVNNLSDLKAKVEDYCTNNITDGTFVMSNSVYKDKNETLVIGTPVTNGKVKTSASAALADPVDIYVERVVAKVRASEKEDGMAKEDIKLSVDGVETSYTINIDGMALSNLTDKANLLKSLETYKETSWVWNDYNNFRSFWEEMPGMKDGKEQVTVSKRSWNDISGDTHYNSSATAGSTCFEQYILPNTFSSIDEVINTSIMVAAHLTDADGNNADLVWIRGGYTTNDGALNVIANAVSNQFAYYKKTGDNSYKTLEPTDFDWTGDTNKGYSCYAQLKATFGTDSKVYTFNDNVPTEVVNGVTNVNNYLSADDNSLHARKYTDGKCYYFVEIEHVAAKTGDNATVAIKGIVRNHIYDLTLNSIQGPGIPVFNPEDKVIPQNPEDENLFYLGARVNVLDWRIVSQGIDFGKQ